MLICLGNEYFISYKNLTRDKFIKSCCVREGSWAEELVNRIFDCLFANTTNLLEEYKEFFQIEYPTFAEFIQKRYGLSRSKLKKIKGNSPPDHILAHGYLDSEGDHNTAQLIEFSDEIRESIEKILAEVEKL